MTPPDSFLDRFAAWASARPDIRAVLLIGSRARTDRSADQWSDYDLVVITDGHDPVVEDTTWLPALGTPLLTITESAAVGGLLERRVLFTDGLDADFVFIDVAQLRDLIDGGSDVRDALSRGHRWIVDKDGLAPLLDSVSVALPAEMDPEKLATAVQDFWYHAVWTAKKLRRGEIWVAKGCCDTYLKKLLLQMMEWHARSKFGRGHDTWFRGRFLEEWLEPAVALRLRRVFAVYDAASVRSALVETMDLFTALADELEARTGMTRDRTAERRARELVDRTLDAG